MMIPNLELPVPLLHWLADVVIQVSILMACLLGLSVALSRRLSAARGNALMTAAALAIPCLFFVAATLPAKRFFHRESAGVRLHDTGGLAPVPATVSRAIVLGNLAGAEPIDKEALKLPGQAGDGASRPVPEASPRFSLFSAVVWLWFAGIAVWWIRLGIGLLSLRCLARSSGRKIDASWGPIQRCLREESAAMRVTGPIGLIPSPVASMPMTWGLTRFYLALPEEAKSWDKPKIRHVLRHELAHMARRDSLKAWLASGSLALLWFHPLVWWSRCRLIRTREAACDDLALRGAASSERDAYVRNLVEIIASRTRPHGGWAWASGLAMGMGYARSLKGRIVAILDENRSRKELTRTAVYCGLPVWLAMIFVLGSLAAYRSVRGQEVPRAAEAKDVPAIDEIETRTYALVEGHLSYLLRDAEWSESPEDPFADAPAPTVGRMDLSSFEPLSAAASARSVFNSHFGIRIRSSDPVNLKFVHPFQLEVTAPRSILESIDWALDSIVDGQHVELKLQMLELDDPKWLAEQLASRDGEVPRAGTMSAERFASLRRAVEERGGEWKAFPVTFARTGQEATVEMIRELIYPTEYDPPEIPQQWKPNQDGRFVGPFPVTPSTPTAFETRNIGLAWKVKPLARRDGSIFLEMEFEDVQFLGFVNYGSPINAVAKGLTGERSVTLTENRIAMPVFETARVTTSLLLSPGEVMVITGFSTEPDAAISKVLDEKANVASLKVEKRKNRVFVIEAHLTEN